MKMARDLSLCTPLRSRGEASSLLELGGRATRIRLNVGRPPAVPTERATPYFAGGDSSNLRTRGVLVSRLEWQGKLRVYPVQVKLNSDGVFGARFSFLLVAALTPPLTRRPSLVSRKRATICAAQLLSLASERRVGDESGLLGSDTQNDEPIIGSSPKFLSSWRSM